MKIKISILSLVSVLALACALPATAQTYLSTTTLSSAVAASSVVAPTIQVASATGITAGSTLLFVDNEGMFVNAVNGTTLSVTRGYYSGRVAGHASGALVWFGPPIAFGWSFASGAYPTGTCTRSSLGVNNNYLPFINTENGDFFDCVGGKWVKGTGSYNDFLTVYQPNPGAVLYTSINTAGTTIAAATSMYCSEIDVQASKYVTGLAPLNGATVGTDKHLVILYDATGNVLANSAIAGATSAGASTYQHYNFTTPYFVVGPAKYYACLQSNGTTDGIRMLITSVQDGVTTKAVTGQTFGTIASTFTVPTTFTTAVGPYWQLY